VSILILEPGLFCCSLAGNRSLLAAEIARLLFYPMYPESASSVRISELALGSFSSLVIPNY
jgi:hypothetical protein